MTESSNKNPSFVEVNFSVTGQIDISSNLTPVFDHKGSICGYKTTDGKVVKLIVALEIEDPQTNQFSYVTSEPEMGAMGFNLVSYDDAGWTPLEYVELILTMRSKTTFGIDTENFRVWTGQVASDEAARIANGYGAEVVSLTNLDGTPFVTN